MAVSEAGEAACEGSALAGRNGSVSGETTDAASACHSFWEEVGREAGANGSDGCEGLAQQTGVAHLPQPDLQHGQLACAAEGLPPLRAAIVGTFCHTRMNPSKMTTAVFTNRDVMASGWSFRTANPYTDCQSVRRVGNISSFIPARVCPRRKSSVQFNS